MSQTSRVPLSTLPTMHPERPVGWRNAVPLILVWLGVLFAVGSAPAWMEMGSVRLITEWLCLLALAQMWNLLAGYTGLPSMGQQGFVGIGAYTLVALGLLAEWPIALIVPAAAIVAAVLAIPSGWLLFRLRGAHFAVGSWVLAEVFRLAVSAIPQMAGGSGVSVAPLLTDWEIEFRLTVLHVLATLLGVGATWMVWFLMRTRWGLALRAVRDAEQAAASLGVNVQHVRWGVWVGCAALTATVGVVIFLTRLRVSPDAAFSIEWTTLMLFAVVIGGIGTPWGPVLGSLVFIGLREWLSDTNTTYLIVLGWVIIAATLWLPRGLVAWLPRGGRNGGSAPHHP